MRSEISKKAKNITSWIALLSAICVGALAVAIVLFFKLWWAGLICLAVSMVSGVLIVTLFMSYRAERRLKMRLTSEEAEDARIMELVSPFDAAGKRGSSASPDKAHSANKTDDEKGPEASDETEENPSDENMPVAANKNDDANEQRTAGFDDDKTRSDGATTLEMRPPLRILSVEEAKAHAPRSHEENDPQNDKNEG